MTGSRSLGSALRPSVRVPGRRLGAVLAAVGVLLAVPTVVWPVLVTTFLVAAQLVFIAQWVGRRQSSSTWRRPDAIEPDVAPVRVDSGDEPTTPSVVGTGRLLEAGETGGRGRPVFRTTVGFSDDAPRPGERPDRRFEPPT